MLEVGCHVKPFTHNFIAQEIQSDVKLNLGTDLKGRGFSKNFASVFQSTKKAINVIKKVSIPNTEITERARKSELINFIESNCDMSCA